MFSVRVRNQAVCQSITYYLSLENKRWRPIKPQKSFSNSRRNFIKMAAAGSAVASALSAASATTAQEAAVRLPENEPGSYEPPEYIVIGTSDVAVLNKVDLVDILQATSGRAAITVGQLWEEEPPRSRIVFIGSRGGVNSSEISHCSMNTPASKPIYRINHETNCIRITASRLYLPTVSCARASNWYSRSENAGRGCCYR